MMKKVAAISAAFMLGTMSHVALAQAPAAPAAGTTVPAKPAATAPALPPAKPAAAAPAKAPAVGAKAPAPVNACKGLAEADCGGKAEACSWIKAYKTKAGKQVAGYCKSKPKPKAAKAAAPAAKAAAPAAKAAAPAAKAVTAPATAVKPAAPAAMPAAGKPAAPAPKN